MIAGEQPHSKSRRRPAAVGYLGSQLAAERPYLQLGINLLKSVAAVRGDYVCADGAKVRINRRVVALPRT